MVKYVIARCRSRTTRANDYVILITRIEGGRVVICNVTLQKSQE